MVHPASAAATLGAKASASAMEKKRIVAVKRPPYTRAKGETEEEGAREDLGKQKKVREKIEQSCF